MTQPRPEQTTYSVECPVCGETLMARGLPIGPNLREMILRIHLEYCKGKTTP